MKNLGKEYNKLQNSSSKQDLTQTMSISPDLIYIKKTKKITFRGYIKLIFEQLAEEEESKRLTKLSKIVEKFLIFCEKLGSYVNNYRNDLRDRIFIAVKKAEYKYDYELIRFYILIYEMTKNIEIVKSDCKKFFTEEIEDFQIQFKNLLNDEKLIPIIKKELENDFMNLEKKYGEKKNPSPRSNINILSEVDIKDILADNSLILMIEEININQR